MAEVHFSDVDIRWPGMEPEGVSKAISAYFEALEAEATAAQVARALSDVESPHVDTMEVSCASGP